MTINVDDVVCVYVGKPGCMCGCLGTWSYNMHQLWRGKLHRGYDIDPDEINPFEVRRVVRKIESSSEPIEYPEDTDVFISKMIGKKVYALYFNAEDDKARAMG